MTRLFVAAMLALFCTVGCSSSEPTSAPASEAPAADSAPAAEEAAADETPAEEEAAAAEEG